MKYFQALKAELEKKPANENQYKFHKHSKSNIPFMGKNTQISIEKKTFDSHNDFKKTHTGAKNVVNKKDSSSLAGGTRKKSSSIIRASGHKRVISAYIMPKGPISLIKPMTKFIKSKESDRYDDSSNEVELNSKAQGNKEENDELKAGLSIDWVLKSKVSHKRIKSDKIFGGSNKPVGKPYQLRDDSYNRALKFVYSKRKNSSPNQMVAELYQSLQNPLTHPTNSAAKGCKAVTSNQSPLEYSHSAVIKPAKAQPRGESGREHKTRKSSNTGSGRKPVTEEGSKKALSGVQSKSHSKEKSLGMQRTMKVELRRRQKSGIMLATDSKKKSESTHFNMDNKSFSSKTIDSKRKFSSNKKSAELNKIKINVDHISNKNSTDEVRNAPLRKQKKAFTFNEGKVNPKANLLANLDVNLSSNTQSPSFSDIIKELNLDSKREKEMKETLEIIKAHWRDKGEAPKTDMKFYKIGRVLGKGAFGKVNLGIHKLTGKFVAIKSISKKLMRDEASENKVMKEVSIWKELQHPSVIQLYESFESEKHLLYVEELCVGGDLLTYVRRRRKLKEKVAKFILKQILDGMHYCHSRSILHRDIKLDNILLNSEGKIKVHI